MTVGIRSFRVWKYVVNYSRLVIRSPMDITHGMEENIDLIFVGVDYMLIPNMSQRAYLASWHPRTFDPTPEEIEFVTNGTLHKPSSRLFVVRDEKIGKWYIGAEFLHIQYNNMLGLRSPIDLP